MTKAAPGKWDEQRRETRRLVAGVARMAQRTFLILGEDEQSSYPCKILDASDNGYRIGLRPMPTLTVGNEVTLEYTDKTRRKFYIRWIAAHEIGLQAV
ncbi:hypothetical protein [Acidocella sp.]|uniref:hypothetical protein n=1 Tax=Acidocella sp. TaxID=50710 RepID=UPI002D7E2B00|nr:hypothetical protein [Acidocella sp.]